MGLSYIAFNMIICSHLMPSLSRFYFYHGGMLYFAKGLFCTNWNKRDFCVWVCLYGELHLLTYICLAIPEWSYLVFLNSVCKYVIENFSFFVHWGNWPMILFCCCCCWVFICFWYQGNASFIKRLEMLLPFIFYGIIWVALMLVLLWWSSRVLHLIHMSWAYCSCCLFMLWSLINVETHNWSRKHKKMVSVQCSTTKEKSVSHSLHHSGVIMEEGRKILGARSWKRRTWNHVFWTWLKNYTHELKSSCDCPHNICSKSNQWTLQHWWDRD